MRSQEINQCGTVIIPKPIVNIAGCVFPSFKSQEPPGQFVHNKFRSNYRYSSLPLANGDNRFRSVFMLYMLMRSGYISELRSPSGLLFIPQMIYTYGEPRWNDTDRRKPKTSEKTQSWCQFVHHKSKID
jgi:hypothetical protein